MNDFLDIKIGKLNKKAKMNNLKCANLHLHIILTNMNYQIIPYLKLYLVDKDDYAYKEYIFRIN